MQVLGGFFLLMGIAGLVGASLAVNIGWTTKPISWKIGGVITIVIALISIAGGVGMILYKP